MGTEVEDWRIYTKFDKGRPETGFCTINLVHLKDITQYCLGPSGFGRAKVSSHKRFKNRNTSPSHPACSVVLVKTFHPKIGPSRLNVQLNLHTGPTPAVSRGPCSPYSNFCILHVFVVQIQFFLKRLYLLFENFFLCTWFT